jgi:hypothetical protein
MYVCMYVYMYVYIYIYISNVSLFPRLKFHVDGGVMWVRLGLGFRLGQEFTIMCRGAWGVGCGE